MRKETLNRNGINAKKDISANVIEHITNGDILPEEYGLDNSDLERLRSIKSFNEEFVGEHVHNEEPLDSPKKAAKFISTWFETTQKEASYVILMNSALKPISVEKLSEGEASYLNINLRKLARMCLNENVTQVILAHNHPSDICYPSKGDITLTNDITNFLEEIKVKLADHLIICNKSFYSFNLEREQEI